MKNMEAKEPVLIQEFPALVWFGGVSSGAMDGTSPLSRLLK